MKSFYVRNMLLGYDKQLVTARRLARYRRSLRAADLGDEVAISREAKRRQLVERVSKEVVENLLISGSENQILRDIRKRLEQDFGERFFFEYPTTDQELQVLRETADGPREVSPQEKINILNRLWKITLDKVDETML